MTGGACPTDQWQGLLNSLILSCDCCMCAYIGREQVDLQDGAVRKAVLDPGEGTASPVDGDLVL